MAFFDAAIRDLIPASSLSAEDKSYLSFALSNVFFAFDRDESATVDASELTSAMLLFCSGRKSDKLALSFDLFDQDNDGTVSREELWRFIRCFLTVLFALNEDSATQDADDMWRKIDMICVEVCARILSEINASEKGFVSFYEFATWYTEQGFHLVPFLELLDLTKWPLLDIAAGDAAELATEADQFAASDSSDDRVAFRFDLVGGKALELTSRDVESLETVLASTRLDEYTPEDLVDLFTSASENGALSKGAFDACMRELIPGNSLSTSEKEFLSANLSNIFYAFEREGGDTVRVKEFVGGFVLFASGNKSEKLALTFTLLDSDDAGGLTDYQLARFLRSVLTVLFALNENSANQSAEAVWTTIDESALNFASTVFESLGIDPEASVVTFEQFADWYTNGGFSIIPYMELLSLSKWGFTAAPVSEGDGAPDVAEGQVDADLDLMHSVRAATHLDTVAPFTFLKELIRAKGTTELTKDVFNCAIAKVVRMDGLDKSAMDMIAYVLSSIYYSFEGEHGYPDVSELFSGMCVLLAGSVQEKLSIMCDVFDVNQSGTLSVGSLAKLVRSVVTVLYAMRGSRLPLGISKAESSFGVLSTLRQQKL